MRLSCGSVPTEYLSWKRVAPSTRIVSAIFCATVSGEPQYIAPIGPAAAAWPARASSEPSDAHAPSLFMYATECGRNSSWACSSVAAT